MVCNFRSRRESKGQPGQATIDLAGSTAYTETEIVLNSSQIQANSGMEGFKIGNIEAIYKAQIC